MDLIAPKSGVVFTGSGDNEEVKGDVKGEIAYGQSKAANVMLGVEAARRWGKDGIISNVSTRSVNFLSSVGSGAEHDANVHVLIVFQPGQPTLRTAALHDIRRKTPDSAHLISCEFWWVY